MSPTRLILVRHGQAHCNVAGVIGGRRGCTGLTDHGRHQTRLLADRLSADHAKGPITAAYTTPLPRARETADIRASVAFAVHYASITRWEQQPLAGTRPETGWRWALLCHNDTAHLSRA